MIRHSDRAVAGQAWVLALGGLGSTLLALFLFGRALGRDFLLYGTDTVAHDYIMLSYGWDQLAREKLVPLWCPYLFSGFPFIGSFAFCPFYPFQFCFAFLPFNTAFTLQYVLALTVAGVTCTWLALRLGISPRVAIFAGLLFCVSGHFLTLVHAGHLQKMIAIAWAPLVLAAALEWGAKGSSGRRAGVLAGIGLAMQLLASHTQIAYATVGAAVILATASVAVANREKPQSWGRLGCRAAASLVLALVLSAAQIFPGLEASSVSNRAGGVPYEEAVETSYPPLELWEFVIPCVFGANLGNAQEPYFGFWGERIVSDFIGWFAVLLALIGLVHGRHRLRWVIGGVGLLALWVGLGKYAGLYKILYYTLPGFAKFRSPGTFMFLSTLGLVLLAALGIDRLVGACDDPPAARRSVCRFTMLVAFVAILLASGMVAFPSGVGRLLHIGTEAQWARFGFILSQKVRLGGVHLLGAGALILGVALLCGGHLRFLRRDLLNPCREASMLPGTLALVLGFATLVTPLDANRAFRRFAPCDEYYWHLLRSSVVSGGASWQKNSPPSRFMGRNLLDNSGLVTRRASPAGYHPIILGRYQQLVQKMGWYHPVFLDNYAVTMLIGEPSLNLPVEHWERHLEESGKLTLWRRVTAPSYFRITRRVVVHPSAADLLDALMNNNSASDALGTQCEFVVGHRFYRPSNPRDVPIHMQLNTRLFCGIPLGLLPPSSAEWLIWNPTEFAKWACDPGGAQHAANRGTICGVTRDVLSDNPSPPCRSYRPGEFRLDAGGCEGIVVAGENWAPGWKATDKLGRPLRTVPVNHSQLGIVVPVGAEEILCRYHPFSWRLGCFAFLSGWATVFVLALCALWRWWHKPMGGQNELSLRKN
ncbi:MAG: hypothetical protein N2Z21_09780 [Candidatus Sumerlaeaceae bacterium]|nr:hypothetical protein [Candidatus Sumerlaeaceae bacterium]